jgi:glycerophosphoryl diester phosphodiesterase
VTAKRRVDVDANGRGTPRPLVIAHRGNSSVAPENTEAAVRPALATGARAVECDVQLSRDGVPIVFHDATLERLCGERGRVASLDAATLTTKRVRVAGRRGSAKASQILTLAQWLDLLPRGVLPVVELKRQRDAAAERRLARAACSVLARRRGPLAVISFSARLVRLASRALPHARAGLVLDRLGRDGALPSGALELARPLVALRRDLASESVVAAARRAGKVVWCWTVDAPEEMVELLARGVSGIVSNRPKLALATVRRAAKGASERR